ncbi:hypothetical protein A7X81_02185, partial [Campylobacter ornithocola]
PWCPTWYWSPNTWVSRRLVVDWSSRAVAVWLRMAVRPSQYGAAMHSLMYPSIDLDDAPM